MSLPAENKQMIMDGVRLILQGLGEDPDRDGLKDTPMRVAKLYDDVLDGQYAPLPKLTTFEEHYKGMVMVHHVPFYGFCEHHMLPFNGHFGIGYIPGKSGKVLGLSKLVRLFRHPCKRVGTQERITEAAVRLLKEHVQPEGGICYVTAEHTCMSLRGVKSPGAKTTTWAYTGVFETNTELRQQFIDQASVVV